jgi:mannose-6-phosphate isomerase class I
MDIKYNDATRNRPWGERPVDAPVIPIDITSYMQQLMLEEAWQKNDRNAITLFKSENLTLTLMALHKDAEMKPGNTFGNELIIIQVIEGLLHLKSGMETLEINKGQMVTVHEQVPYAAQAQQETVCLLTVLHSAK